MFREPTYLWFLLILVVGNAHCLQLTYNISEKKAYGFIVGDIASDLLASGNFTLPPAVGGPRFSILAGPHKSLFNINETSGLLSIAALIDREVVCAGQYDSCELDLEMAVFQPVDNFQPFHTKIIVTDLNDHAPTFDRDKSIVFITEMAQPGLASYPLPPAKDPDARPFSVQRYFLLPSNESAFRVGVSISDDGVLTPSLVLVDSIDRETKPFYNLTLVAYDGGSPPQSGRLSVDVVVLDANDNSPRFESSSYNVTIQEDARPMTVLTQVSAVDVDDGLNGLVTYRLGSTTKDLYGKLFHIDNTTGKLHLTNSLPNDYKGVYNLVVVAEDGGLEPRSERAKVFVNVEDINTHSPNITVTPMSKSGKLEVAENLPPGAFVGYVYAQDEDRGVNGEVTCVALSAKFSLQLVYTKTYKLLTTETFDREKTPVQIVKVRCYDLGSPSTTSFLQAEVRIVDENDNVPQFSRAVYEVSVLENSAIGLSLLALSASDNDAGENAAVVFEVGHQETGNYHHLAAGPYLTIEPESGIVRIGSLLDYEEAAQISVVVLARDKGKSTSLSSSATVLVRILNENDCVPKFTQPSFSFGISENMPPRSDVGTVSAIDSDLPPYNHFVYRLQATPLDSLTTTPPFEIDADSGRLTTTSPLDRERRSIHYFEVLAVDSQNSTLVSTASVTVYIADKNDNPPVIAFPREGNDTVQVSVFSPTGFIVTRILAHDLDIGANSVLVYNVSLEDDTRRHGNSGVFDVDANNGAIYLSESLHGLETKTFRLRATVSDQGSPRESTTSTLVIQVNDSLAFAYTQSLLLPAGSASSVGSIGFHRKLMAIFGSVTAVLVLVLVTAIFFVRRRHPKDPYAEPSDKFHSVPPSVVGDQEGWAADERSLKTVCFKSNVLGYDDLNESSKTEESHTTLSTCIHSDGQPSDLTRHVIVGNQYIIGKMQQPHKELGSSICNGAISNTESRLTKESHVDECPRKRNHNEMTTITNPGRPSSGSKRAQTLGSSTPPFLPKRLDPLRMSANTKWPTLQHTPRPEAHFSTMPKMLNAVPSANSPNILTVSNFCNFERGKTVVFVCGEHEAQYCDKNHKLRNLNSNTISAMSTQKCHQAGQGASQRTTWNKHLQDHHNCATTYLQRKDMSVLNHNGYTDADTDDGQSSTSGSFVLELAHLDANPKTTDV